MTQEEKQLLIKDLCARLPYGVKFQGEDSNVYTLDAANYFAFQVEDMIFKPYLRPISSMTESEIDKLFDILHIDKDGNDDDWIKINDVVGIKFFFPTGKWVENVAEAYDYLNSIHIDYRGLIPMGLALEAPEEMYNSDTEEEEVKVEIPNTLEEALAILDKIVSEEDIEWMKKRGATSVHLTLGMWIRNNWGFWENSDFYQYLCEKTGLTHPDDISNYIIEEFIKRLS